MGSANLSLPGLHPPAGVALSPEFPQQAGIPWSTLPGIPRVVCPYADPLKKRTLPGEQRPPGPGQRHQEVLGSPGARISGDGRRLPGWDRSSERPECLSLARSQGQEPAPGAGGPWRCFNGARGRRAPHLSGTRMAKYLSTATAKRLKMELCVSTSTKQARKRQLWKSVQKPRLMVMAKGMANSPTATSAAARDTRK